MHEQHMSLEGISAGILGNDVAQQTPYRLEQHEMVAVGGGDLTLRQRVRDGRKPFGGELGENKPERCGSHCLGKNSSSTHTSSSVASTCGQCPTESSTNRAPSSAASSREPAMEIGSNAPCITSEGSSRRRD